MSIKAAKKLHNTVQENTIHLTAIFQVNINYHLP